jgi:succinate dehydrogenase / fumarate reductase cytochrome b subunit
VCFAAAVATVAADLQMQERPLSSVAPPAPLTRKKKPAGTLYRGREGMWSWVAHRITGMLTFFFLFAHVLDTALVRVSPDSYDRVIDTYKNPLVNFMEIGLVGAVLYHALNGIRIMTIDFWFKGPKYQRQMLWIIVAVWVAVMVPGAYFMFKHTLENMFGSK